MVSQAAQPGWTVTRVAKLKSRMVLNVGESTEQKDDPVLLGGKSVGTAPLEGCLAGSSKAGLIQL